eukprot:CAMPEP_0184493536 /NCGR_PEP_ID=MMETSP0113_2-20130426/26237_1 /TAXON_ID=91329 /ORGANISM="Norrisiella sphaerica, Strain BC52" /LENGTH=266 /DNA_ID=CAMNT_0026878829 /DNA_START=62 /DNA_END=861 /DNA_ORIENTATION=-
MGRGVISSSRQSRTCPVSRSNNQQQLSLLRIPIPPHAHVPKSVSTRNISRRNLVVRAGPQVDQSILQQQLIMLTTIGAVGGYWWLVLVPSERGRLSKNKKSGEISEYLMDLKKNEDQRPLEKWFLSKWLAKVREPGSEGEKLETDASKAVSARDMQEAVSAIKFDDGSESTEKSDFGSQNLNVAASSPSTPKKQPKAETRAGYTIEELFKVGGRVNFWSLDNPVLVATPSASWDSVTSNPERKRKFRGEILRHAIMSKAANDNVQM